MIKKAVVLVSGGLDSTTCLAIAQHQGYQCHGLSFNYGQKHCSELQAARTIGQQMGLASHRVVDLDLGQIGGSALTDSKIDVPEEAGQGIPVTYVPARNTIFLSYGLAVAEVLQAQHLFIGVNAVDYSGYPDCRPDYIDAFEKMANLATKISVEGQKFKIHTPLMKLSKAEIIQQGVAVGVDYGLTVSCYQADGEGRACGRCESCRLRQKGFQQAGVSDPTRYQAT